MRQENIILKTSPEIARIRLSCGIVEKILVSLKKIMKTGTATSQIDFFCAAEMKRYGAVSAIKGFEEFPYSVCVSVNHIAVHGLPGTYILREGDIVTVDVALSLNGWFGDGAATFPIGTVEQPVLKLIKAAQAATIAGITAAVSGNRLGDVGRAMENAAAAFGCGVAENCAGHGIGRKLHEDPVVLAHGEPGTGLPVVPGMVITIEPLVTLGNGRKITETGNQWSMKTSDGTPTAQFEHTIAVFGDRTEVLTGQLWRNSIIIKRECVDKNEGNT